MGTVKVSPKYQVVIPREVREKMRLKRGQEMVVVVKGGIVSFIPSRPLGELKGFIKGIKKEGIREKKDRI